MTVETIDKMALTLEEWLEILSICELLFDGLVETYCQKKRPEQQLDKKENFCYNIIVRRQVLFSSFLSPLPPSSKKFLQKQIIYLK